MPQISENRQTWMHMSRMRRLMSTTHCNTLQHTATHCNTLCYPLLPTLRPCFIMLQMPILLFGNLAVLQVFGGTVHPSTLKEASFPNIIVFFFEFF